MPSSAASVETRSTSTDSAGGNASTTAAATHADHPTQQREQQLVQLLGRLEQKLEACRRAQRIVRAPRLHRNGRHDPHGGRVLDDGLARLQSVPSESGTEGTRRLVCVSARLPSEGELERGRALSITSRSINALLPLIRSEVAIPVVWIGLPSRAGSTPATYSVDRGAHRAAHASVSSPPPNLSLAGNAPSERTRALVPVHLPPDIEHVFEHFTERQLWSLLHYDYNGLFDSEWSLEESWHAYRLANEAFAEAVSQLYLTENDLVWVHDYPLLLLPQLLRERLLDARIGLYLYTCFPSTEVFRIFPFRERLLRAALQSDLIGFQSFNYQRHFLTSCKRLLGVSGTYARVQVEPYGGHGCALGVYPQGVDTEALQALLGSKSIKRRAAELRERFQGRRLLVGVERLDDRFGGIDLKLAAFEEFLARNPSLRDQCVLVQVALLLPRGGSNSQVTPTATSSAVPPGAHVGAWHPTALHSPRALSHRDEPGEMPAPPLPPQTLAPHDLSHSSPRATVSPLASSELAERRGCRDLIHSVCALVGRINAVYGTLESSPVHFINYEPDFAELLALLTVADACVVSSVRSVMTEIAFEWTLCQHDRGHGVLVLSDFSGATRLFPTATHVNPFDTEAVSLALQEALTMEARERRMRHEMAYEYVSANPVRVWYGNFIEDLDATRWRGREASPWSGLSETALPSEGKEAGAVRDERADEAAQRWNREDVAAPAALGVPGSEAPALTAPALSLAAHPHSRVGRHQLLPLARRLQVRTLCEELERSQKKRLFLLHHDGALVPFQAIAEIAGPPPQVVRLVSVLASDPRHVVLLCSSRDRATVTQWYEPYGHKLGLICESGLYTRLPGRGSRRGGGGGGDRNGVWHALIDAPTLQRLREASWRDLTRETMRAFADRTPGAVVEEGEATLTWHYRDADPDFGNWQAIELQEQLEGALALAFSGGHAPPVQVMSAAALGDRTGRWVRVAPRGVSKRKAVEWVLSEWSASEFDLVVACGEDRFDEEAFAFLQQLAQPPHMRRVLVRVGMSHGVTAADYVVESPREWLDALHQVVLGGTDGRSLVSPEGMSPRRYDSLPSMEWMSGQRTGEAGEAAAREEEEKREDVMASDGAQRGRYGDRPVVTRRSASAPRFWPEVAATRTRIAAKRHGSPGTGGRCSSIPGPLPPPLLEVTEDEGDSEEEEEVAERAVDPHAFLATRSPSPPAE